jgi:aryl-alcohol dehydrogenase-like predicted oxidoreductase
LAPPRALTDYRLLGRSGLRVSPLSMGAMTFGADWGADAAESRRMLDLYLDKGGNFVDTANYYSYGKSEELLGEFLAEKRRQVVLATKYSIMDFPGDVNSGGNQRKNMMRSVEDSLRRLKTDYIDLFYLHIWDATTPPDEVMRGFDDLVSQGKVTYVGVSDTPAWEVSRMQMLAELRGWAPFVALQVEYSLAQRTTERDLLPMAKALGLGVIPWSPLANGMLSGKYTRADLSGGGDGGGEGRKPVMLQSGRVTERVITIAEAVGRVAKDLGKTPAQVALAWVLSQPVVTSPILGARTLAQLEDNLGAFSVDLSDQHLADLDAVSAVEMGFPHDFIASDFGQHMLTGGANIRRR